MKKKSVIAIACAAALMAACAFGLAGCNSATSGHTGGVAATVNGLEIQEDDITVQIENMRESYGWTDDSTMALYLSVYGMTPSSLRDSFLEGMEENKAIEVVCNEKGITVDEADVDAQVSTVRANYKTDAEWTKALENSGYESEDKYREKLREDIRAEKLEEQVAKETESTDALVLEYTKLFAEKFKGAKKSSHILFSADDAEKAQEVLDKINDGTLDFEEAAKEYSTDTSSAEKGGDVGWDCETTFVTGYTDGLAGLSKGEVSGLVESEYGIHIIKCTDVCILESELTSVSQLPTELQDSAKDRVKTMVESADDFDTWVSTLLAGLKVVVNDMPEGVSYNVDMSAYSSSTDDTTDTTTTDDTTTTTTDDTTTTDTTTDMSASASASASSTTSASTSPSASSDSK